MLFATGALVFAFAFAALLIFGVGAMFAVVLLGGTAWCAWVAKKG